MGVPPPETPAHLKREYAVFLSYRHLDNKEPGRQWASWLHYSLETYAVPPDLVGTLNERGEPIPASLFPVFRDEEELPAGADLSKGICQALEHSRTLVVLCSPRVVCSTFVADEIRYFKELGRSAHILALMIDGEPNASEDDAKLAAGLTVRDECLPHALRYGVPLDDGPVIWADRGEPICADVRPEGRPVQGWTTGAAYRESLQREEIHAPEAIDLRVQEYERRLALAKLKIIAGALGVPLGVLTQRDQEYRRREAERRAAEEKTRRQEAERLQALAEQREEEAREANERRQQLLREISRSDQATAEASITDGKWQRGLAYLSRALTSDPQNTVAAASLWNRLAEHLDEPLPDAVLEHKDAVWCAAFSPDSRHLATGSKDGRVVLWEVATGWPLDPPLLHEGPVRSVSFSPDGRSLAAASTEAVLWDLASGRELPFRLRHTDEVTRAFFSPDGRSLLSVSFESVRLWNAAAGSASARQTWGGQGANHVCFSPGGRRVLATQGARAALWDLATDWCGTTIEHNREIVMASFDPSGTWIVTASADGTARLFDGLKGTPLETVFKHEGKVASARFSPDGRRLVTASHDRTVRVWNRNSGQASELVLSHEQPVESATFSPDGRFILSVTADSAFLWEATSGQLVTGPIPHSKGFAEAQFSPDSQHLFTTCDGCNGLFWSVGPKRRPGLTMRHEHGVQNGAFTPDGQRIFTVGKEIRLFEAATADRLGKIIAAEEPEGSVCCSADGTRAAILGKTTARVLDMANGEPIGEPIQYEKGVSEACFSPDGRRLATLHWNDWARVWEVETGRPLSGVKDARTIAFSPDGRRLVSAIWGERVTLWNPKSDEEPGQVIPVGAVVQHACFSPDGGSFATVTFETVQVWDAATGRKIGPALLHFANATSAVFSADSQYLVTTSEDKLARQWEVATGRRVGDFMRHEGAVNRAAFSRDGRQIVTASSDKTARVWEAGTGRPLGLTLRHGEEVTSASFSSDGRTLLTTSWDKTARLWPVGFPTTTEEWLPDFVAALSGVRFNEEGVLAEVPIARRIRLRLRVASRTLDAPKDAPWTRLFQAWFTPPSRRPALF